MPEAKIMLVNMEISFSGDGSSMTIKNIFLPYNSSTLLSYARDSKFREEMQSAINPAIEKLLQNSGVNKEKFLQMQLDMLEQAIVRGKNVVELIKADSPITVILDVETQKVTFISGGKFFYAKTPPEYKELMKKSLLDIRSTLIKTLKNSQ